MLSWRAGGADATVFPRVLPHSLEAPQDTNVVLLSLTCGNGAVVCHRWIKDYGSENALKTVA